MIKIPILTATFFDLQNFDFKFAGIKLLKVGSPQFLNYCKKYLKFIGDDSPGVLIKSYIRSMDKNREDKFAIVAIDPVNTYKYKEIYRVFELLLIAYPSDLKIQYFIEYYDENTGSTMTHWHRRYTGEYPGKPLFDKGDVSGVNGFFERVFYKMDNRNFVSFMIDNYISSFEVSHYHLQYINLCICLEAVNENPVELNYRLRRTVAILCAENAGTAEFIFHNLKLMYGLRSKIVHGGHYEISKVIEYLPFLKAVVSRTIIELLVHEIATPAELDKNITKIGFGDRAKLSKNWKAYNFNILALSEANYASLKS